MESPTVSTQKQDPAFETFRTSKIDALRHTLYETLLDPRLDQLSIDERVNIYNGWHTDMVARGIAYYNRQALDGCGTERTIFDPSTGSTTTMVNFASNDYLNMSQHPLVVEAAIQTLRHYGAGAGAACNASGQTKVKHDLEVEIANTLETEKALVFNTGHAANVGVLKALLKSNDVAIVDMLAHASIMDGIENKNKMFFKHNDMTSLESVLKRADRQYSNKIVIVDGVYSMDGDIANIPAISALCKKYKALLMVDEAHAFGVIGKNGLGILDHFNMPSDTIDILVGTLSKAIGSSGGFVTGKASLINYFEMACRTYLCTTGPFVAANAAALASIRIIKQDQERRERLWNHVGYFKEKCVASNFNIGDSETAIFPIILADHNKAFEVTRVMGNKGVQVSALPYPIVARKQTRLRMTVTADMTLAQLDKGHTELCAAIKLYDANENADTSAEVNEPNYIAEYQQTRSDARQSLLEKQQTKSVAQKQ
jgi:glycine C-acetyltransferase